MNRNDDDMLRTMIWLDWNLYQTIQPYSNN